MADDSAHSVKIAMENTEAAIEAARAGRSRLTPEALALDGMSGAKTRHLYNNLAANASRHLEIGSYKGSSTVAALCGNPHLHVTAVDSWQEFGGPKDEFAANTRAYSACGSGQLHAMECDCWDALAALKRGAAAPFDMYLYDGGHTYEDQFRALTEAVDVLAPVCVVVVDDYDWSEVRRGTTDALAELQARGRVRVHLSRHVQASGCSDAAGFWNGAGVFVLEVERPATTA